MTGDQALDAWLQWLTHERRAAPRTVAPPQTLTSAK